MVVGGAVESWPHNFQLFAFRAGRHRKEALYYLIYSLLFTQRVESEWKVRRRIQEIFERGRTLVKETSFVTPDPVGNERKRRYYHGLREIYCGQRDWV